MKHKFAGLILLATVCPLWSFVLFGCGGHQEDIKAEAPPPAQVEQEMNPNDFKVDNPDRYALVTAVERKIIPELNVTGVVQPDINRSVPVLSIAAGRVVEIKTRLGDQVEKGQVLLRVQSNDVSTAYQTYLKAVNDEHLARVQYERAKTLYEKGAISKGALEQAEDTENDAKVDLNAALEQLRLLGVDKDHPSAIVNVVAPISGIVTDQEVTNAAGVQGLPGPYPFTISDLSYVWIICDVYENDLDAVHLGEFADIHLNAYPDRVFKGRIDNIFPILDPNIRTAKVRLEVPNPGKIMKIGIFATAMFYGKKAQTRAVVPASAILHLHDRTWVYVPLGSGHFKRIEVQTGNMLPDNQEEILSGIQPGAQVLQDSLAFNNAVEQ
ncbi:MAG: efflux RND transporter periplasmic adaptor subunit [Candidatus Acidiferrum sp.]